MTWEIRDTQKHRNTSAPGASSLPATPEPLGPAMPGAAEALPTIAAARAWEQRSDDAGSRYTMAQRQVIASMGLWPEDAWQAWKQLATRGVVAL